MKLLSNWLQNEGKTSTLFLFFLLESIQKKNPLANLAYFHSSTTKFISPKQLCKIEYLEGEIKKKMQSRHSGREEKKNQLADISDLDKIGKWDTEGLKISIQCNVNTKKHSYLP